MPITHPTTSPDSRCRKTLTRRGETLKERDA